MRPQLVLGLLLSISVALPVLADTTLTFIDVGRGDAIWASDDTGHDVLIDAGAGAQAYDYLMAAPPEDLDVVVWTHGHEDHIGGMDEILSRFPVGQIIWNGFDYNSDTFNDLLGLAIGYGIPLAVANPGDTYAWGESRATVLLPDRQYYAANDSSVVLKLRHCQLDVLLTGDMELEAENALLDEGLDLSAHSRAIRSGELYHLPGLSQHLLEPKMGAIEQHRVPASL